MPSNIFISIRCARPYHNALPWRNDIETATLETIGAIIPAFNAEARLARVVEQVSRIIPKDRIIIVDDGSVDRTYAVASALGAVLLRHASNMGKGAALATAFKKAREMGIPFVVTLDADGQHNPSEIPAFVAAQQETGADIIVGNRMADTKDMPPLRLMTNRFTSLLISLRAGRRIPDSQNGYRLLSTELLARMPLVTTRYDTESEILIKAARMGAAIGSVPVQTIYEGARSSINPLADSFRFLRMVIRSFFW
ncbi:MAG: glycosyltransferase family 2 protein [Chitinivibrionia bacterium]|nr:glycosyltransferase family 2 protein [Chitinivibrionia bacterium]